MQTLIPFAHQAPHHMKTKAIYSGGYPRGAVVHFTAGTFRNGIADALSSIEIGIKNGYTYLCIARSGELVQAHPVNGWGYHAGESAWRNATVGKLVGSVSDDLIGIEMCNAGMVKPVAGNFKTYWGQTIYPADVREVKEADYGCPSGFYHKYSPEQEAMLIKTLLWLKQNDSTGHFSFDDVLGHHEVAGKKGIGYFRKSDPGGSLSMRMSEFRAYLKSLSQGGMRAPLP